MRKQYTEARSQVLQAIKDFQTKNGYFPSYREIGAAVGIASVSTIWFHIDSLLQDGLIEREIGKARGLRLPGCNTEDFMDGSRQVRVCFTCRKIHFGGEVESLETWMESHKKAADDDHSDPRLWNTEPKRKART